MRTAKLFLNFHMKRLSPLFVLGLALLANCGGGSASVATSPGSNSSSSSSSSSVSQVSGSLTSTNAVSLMSPGVNLGNTLEAIGWNGTPPFTTSQETAWGAPPANQATFDGFKAAGFKSVRIPVAWSQYADANYTIAPFWLARVKQVVDYARNDGLFVIINIHWDGGGIEANASQQAASNTKLKTLWTQIANNFKDYDDHLLFSGMNEVGDDSNSNNMTTEECGYQKGFQQTFVDAVRATGGNNATRFLIVQGYYTDVDKTVSCDAVLPKDSATGRLMEEVHYYSPYDFTINGSSNIWQWGANATDPSATETWANESYVDAEFQKMKSTFVDKGVPVILGEYGAYNKPAYPDMDQYRLYWDKYITHSAYQHGMVPMYWDTGGLIDRNTGAQIDKGAISAIIGAVN